jgi:8-amino-7-oxononanoate synthase
VEIEQSVREKTMSPPSGSPLEWLAEQAQARADDGSSRVLNPRAGDSGLIDFASNDYLGLSRDPRVIAAAIEATTCYGFGATASPLVAGWTNEHEMLVGDLAAFEGTEAAVVFSTGFAAVAGAIASLVGPGDAVYNDRLNHACLIAGTRMSGATLRVYPHNEVNRLDESIRRDRAGGRYRRILIATDTVFSMDGDLAPLVDLVDIANRHQAILMVDEAHATGVFGPEGRGAAAALGVAEQIDVKAGTLSKALGSIGGFIAGSKLLIDHLINRASTLMFSTALPPAACAAARMALSISRAEPWRRERATGLGDQLRLGLREQGWEIRASQGPIVPLIVGEAVAAVELSNRIRAEGYLAPAIRPPTVPRGTSRIRLSTSAANMEEQVRGLVHVIGRNEASTGQC